MTTATRRPRLMTADDLFRMPDDGYRYELVRGELRKIAPSGFEHGIYGSEIHDSISPYVRSRGLGRAPNSDTGYRLAADHVRAPDASFIRRERVDAVGREPGYFPGPPDLAVEVISPNDLLANVVEKVADYLEAGTLAVIVVNPRNWTVSVHRPNADTITLTEGDTLEVPDVIPGWSMPVADIFSLG